MQNRLFSTASNLHSHLRRHSLHIHQPKQGAPSFQRRCEAEDWYQMLQVITDRNWLLFIF